MAGYYNIVPDKLFYRIGDAIMDIAPHAAISCPIMLYRTRQCVIGSAAIIIIYGSMGRYVVYGHIYFTDIFVPFPSSPT